MVESQRGLSLYLYQAEVVRVIDGDTLDLSIDLGFEISNRQRVRLFGINTPEISGVKHSSDEYRRGIAARDFVVEWLDGRTVSIKSHDGKRIRQGKFGRWIVELERSDGANLSRDLVRTGHAIEVVY
jgi:micrococcal nuclease